MCYDNQLGVSYGSDSCDFLYTRESSNGRETQEVTAVTLNSTVNFSQLDDLCASMRLPGVYVSCDLRFSFYTVFVGMLGCRWLNRLYTLKFCQ